MGKGEMGEGSKRGREEERKRGRGEATRILYMMLNKRRFFY